MRNILTTTALVMMTALPVYAESHMQTQSTPADTAQSTMPDSGTVPTPPPETGAAETPANTATVQDPMSDTADTAPAVDTEAAEPGATAGAEGTEPMVTTPGAVIFDDGPLTAEKLDGMRVIGGDGERVGEISQILLTDDGRINRVVVDVGGFLGIGEKPVALPFSDLELVGSDTMDVQEVRVGYTEDELNGMERWSE
ncbi:PRC-barrel domain-containing protein [Tropicimonas aquimaris]|uniref:PRC-barrel domain-containing protein n=1 Tax=Tropicimonas aquimaris TaxID=914152 RepID=A0ABW3IJA4_9RHOB